MTLKPRKTSRFPRNLFLFSKFSGFNLLKQILIFFIRIVNCYIFDLLICLIYLPQRNKPEFLYLDAKSISHDIGPHLKNKNKNKNNLLNTFIIKQDFISFTYPISKTLQPSSTVSVAYCQMVKLSLTGAEK